MNDVVLNKKFSIERCVEKIKSYYRVENGTTFDRDFMRQDAVAMNLQRACGQAIDLANYVIRDRKLGMPKTSRESFELLALKGIISESVAMRLQKMVGLNILVHEYQKELSILQSIIENHLDDFIDYTHMIVKQFQD